VIPALESFVDAFDDRVSGPRRTCDCGVEFWDTYNSGYSWEDGEREGLEANPAAKGLPYAVGAIHFEGRHFVPECECWKPRALKIIAFLMGHDEAIAAFLTLEKRRKQVEADRSPTVG
jgi:hypothetical protein